MAQLGKMVHVLGVGLCGINYTEKKTWVGAKE